MVALQIIGLADGRPSEHDGRYVVTFDPDFEGGLGRVWTTPASTDAHWFQSIGDALKYWNQVSSVLPVRPDGKPNKPLTAYSVSIAHVGYEQM